MGFNINERLDILHSLGIGIPRIQEASVIREVLYNILTEFGVAMKLGWLIKMCLNKISS
jgi:hypothetical protein